MPGGAHLSLLEIQAYALAVAILCGMSLGLLFDVFLASKSPGKRKGILPHIGDFFIWLPITVVVFFSLIYGNWGEIRVFSFLGMAAGFWLYKTMGSPVILPVIRFCFETIRKARTGVGRSVKRAGGYVARSAHKAVGGLFDKVRVCRKKEASGEVTYAGTACENEAEVVKPAGSDSKRHLGEHRYLEAFRKYGRREVRR